MKAIIKLTFFMLLLALMPMLSMGQKVMIRGHISNPKGKVITIYRIKNPNSWKVFKGSNYESEIDVKGNFDIELPIANSGFWKLEVGKKRSKIQLNINQNVNLELDSNLVVIKILRQDLIDSPMNFKF
jgi:hypothetical protein